MKACVIIPTHAPNRERLARTLRGLQAQTLPVSDWETLLVDNASPAPLDAASFRGQAPANLVVTREPVLGLTAARVHGIRLARGELIVFVDDDNILAPDFLAEAVSLFSAEPRIGVAGGRVVPEWETRPPSWAQPFLGLLALRDHGPARLIARGSADARWPDIAPVGAGLVIRRTLAQRYADAIAAAPARLALDRQAGALTSGGDCDLVFSVLHAGHDVAYEPRLQLTHLIPAARVAPTYLERLNRGVMRSWVRVLAMHGQCPWPAIARATVPLRAARAWWRRRAWRSPAERIRWAGDVGQFEGQADLAEAPLS